jgi:hypothetical protein
VVGVSGLYIAYAICAACVLVALIIVGGVLIDDAANRKAAYIEAQARRDHERRRESRA